MKIAFILFGLTLAGCAHAPLDPPKTAMAPMPCIPNSCGKTVVWENL